MPEKQPVSEPVAPKEQGKADTSGSTSQDSNEQGNSDSKSAEASSSKDVPDQPGPVMPVKQPKKQGETKTDEVPEKSDVGDLAGAGSDDKRKTADKTPDDSDTANDESVVKDTGGDDTPATGEELKVEVLSQNSDIAADTAEESNVLAGFYHSNKGAVIALSLGLCITAMLLVFVGCRLRNVKKRLRRGRPLNSNEADYLINGMYL